MLSQQPTLNDKLRVKRLAAGMTERQLAEAIVRLVCARTGHGAAVDGNTYPSWSEAGSPGPTVSTGARCGNCSTPRRTPSSASIPREPGETPSACCRTAVPRLQQPLRASDPVSRLRRSPCPSRKRRSRFTRTARASVNPTSQRGAGEQHDDPRRAARDARAYPRAASRTVGLPGNHWVPVTLALLAAVMGRLVYGAVLGQDAAARANRHGYRAGSLLLGVQQRL